MEAATIEQVNVGPKDPAVKRLYTYSAWVHVGAGADDCEGFNQETGEVTCGDRGHFHAWVRLPNEIQIEEIRDKASAAKARRTRQLRDTDTDAWEILEEELDQLARLGDTAIPDIVSELLQKDFWRFYGEAAKDVQETEAPDRAEGDEPYKPYEHIERDQDRFGELVRMNPDDRPQDEYDELDRHLAAYNEAVEARVKEIEKPHRDSYESKSINELIDLVRDDRITAEAGAAFMRVYTQEEWLLCTLKCRAGEPVFPSLDVLKAAPDEVLRALKETFDDLEKQERGQSGNS